AAAAGIGVLVIASCEGAPIPNQPQATAAPNSTPGGTIYVEPTRPIEERVNDLLGRMTIEEKISQMGTQAPAIERLGIPQYNWWSEALHGVARAGIATVFPQVIGLASTWNPDLIYRMAEVISDEAR